MNQIDRYISNFIGVKKEWLSRIVDYLRKQDYGITETYELNIPTYHIGDHVIAFAAQKRYFSFYTYDERIILLIKYYIPKAICYKDCVKIKYTTDNVVEIICDVCLEIMNYNTLKKTKPISRFIDVCKWTKLSYEKQQSILNNAYCNTCGTTVLVNYTIHNDRYGLILKGKCYRCNSDTCILIENELNKYVFDEDELIEIDLTDEELENYYMRDLSLYDLNNGLESDFVDDDYKVNDIEFSLNEISKGCKK